MRQLENRCNSSRAAQWSELNIIFFFPTSQNEKTTTRENRYTEKFSQQYCKFNNSNKRVGMHTTAPTAIGLILV